MTQSSRVISVRLNTRKKPERDALALWDSLVADKNEPRHIFTDAILFRAGKTPEMYSREDRIDHAVSSLEDRLDDLEALRGLDDKLIQIFNAASGTEAAAGLREYIDGRFDRIEEAIEKSVVDLLRRIKTADPKGFKEFANSDERDGRHEFSDTFVRNAQQAVRKTWLQKGNGTPESDDD